MKTCGRRRRVKQEGRRREHSKTKRKTRRHQSVEKTRRTRQSRQNRREQAERRTLQSLFRHAFRYSWRLSYVSRREHSKTPSPVVALCDARDAHTISLFHIWSYLRGGVVMHKMHIPFIHSISWPKSHYPTLAATETASAHTVPQFHILFGLFAVDAKCGRLSLADNTGRRRIRVKHE